LDQGLQIICHAIECRAQFGHAGIIRQLGAGIEIAFAQLSGHPFQMGELSPQGAHPEKGRHPQKQSGQPQQQIIKRLDFAQEIQIVNRPQRQHIAGVRHPLQKQIAVGQHDNIAIGQCFAVAVAEPVGVQRLDLDRIGQ
jgi:hypothetical protein